MYDALSLCAVKGKNVGELIACPGCGAVGELFYTAVQAQRGSFWLEGKCIEYRTTPAPLCRCNRCRGRFRVLPLEIAPFKSYTLAVIETACAHYSDPQLPRVSLRRTVEAMGRGHPHRSTLHGWLGGLGARTLGRLDQPPHVPVSVLLAETRKRLNAELFSLWRKPVKVAARKYRSPERAEQLEACAKLFQTARKLFPQTPFPFSGWEKWLQSRFHVTAWSFPSRFCCTAIQQHPTGRRAVWSAASKEKDKKQRNGKNHEARSPPHSLLEI